MTQTPKTSQTTNQGAWTRENLIFGDGQSRASWLSNRMAWPFKARWQGLNEDSAQPIRELLGELETQFLEAYRLAVVVADTAVSLMACKPRQQGSADEARLEEKCLAIIALLETKEREVISPELRNLCISLRDSIRRTMDHLENTPANRTQWEAKLANTAREIADDVAIYMLRLRELHGWVDGVAFSNTRLPTPSPNNATDNSASKTDTEIKKLILQGIENDQAIQRRLNEMDKKLQSLPHKEVMSSEDLVVFCQKVDAKTALKNGARLSLPQALNDAWQEIPALPPRSLLTKRRYYGRWCDLKQQCHDREPTVEEYRKSRPSRGRPPKKQ